MTQAQALVPVVFQWCAVRLEQSCVTVLQHCLFRRCEHMEDLRAVTTIALGWYWTNFMYRKRYAPLAVAPDPVCVSAELHVWFWLQQPEPEEIWQQYAREVKHWKAACAVWFMTRQSTEMKNLLHIMHCMYRFLLRDLDKNREQLVGVKEMADGCWARDNRC